MFREEELLLSSAHVPPGLSMCRSKIHLFLCSGRLLILLLQFQAEVERKLSQMILDKKFHGESLHPSELCPVFAQAVAALPFLL